MLIFLAKYVSLLFLLLFASLLHCFFCDQITLLSLLTPFYHFHPTLRLDPAQILTLRIKAFIYVHWSRNTSTMNTVFILIFNILASSHAEPDTPVPHEDGKGNKQYLLMTIPNGQRQIQKPFVWESFDLCAFLPRPAPWAKCSVHASLLKRLKQVRNLFSVNKNRLLS